MGIDTTEVSHLAADLAAAPGTVAAGSARAVAATTRSTHRDARRFAPELTGYLRARITARSAGLVGTVVAEAEYSEFVEEGTSDTAPQPFMRPAAELNAGRLADGLADAGESIL